MRHHLPVLVAAGLLAAIPAPALAAGHISYDDCDIVTYGAPATAQDSNCVGEGFPVGADTYTVETFPDHSTVAAAAVIPSSGEYRYDYPSTVVQYGRFTIAVWKSKAAFTRHAAPLASATFHVTP